MKPELERLLAALATRDNASPAEFAEADEQVERLLQPILERPSPIGRAEFLRALQTRYRAYLKASEHPPTLPPSVIAHLLVVRRAPHVRRDGVPLR